MTVRGADPDAVAGRIRGKASKVRAGKRVHTPPKRSRIGMLDDDDPYLEEEE